jgi:integrase
LPAELPGAGLVEPGAQDDPQDFPFYAGLRAGELQALQWDDIDLHANLIHVRQGWDARAGFIPPKATPASAASRSPKYSAANCSPTASTKAPAAKASPSQAAANATGPSRPTLALHSYKAWNDNKLTPIGLHECRHTYATYMIAAGINTKALSTYMGHSSITITLDRYGHLLPGNESEAAEFLETWLATSTRTLH